MGGKSTNQRHYNGSLPTRSVWPYSSAYSLCRALSEKTISWIYRKMPGNTGVQCSREATSYQDIRGEDQGWMVQSDRPTDKPCLGIGLTLSNQAVRSGDHNSPCTSACQQGSVWTKFQRRHYIACPWKPPVGATSVALSLVLAEL